MAYTAFLDELFPGRLKFSLTDSKVTTLAEALKRAYNFIKTTKVCA